MICLAIPLNPNATTPRDLRIAFAAALREAILRAYQHGRLDVGQAEELWRVVPDPEHA